MASKAIGQPVWLSLRPEEMKRLRTQAARDGYVGLAPLMAMLARAYLEQSTTEDKPPEPGQS